MKYTDFDFNGKRILITGGAGFIGSNLALHFQENYPNSEVVVLDKFRDTPPENGKLDSLGHFKNLINFKGKTITVDINNKDWLAYTKGFDFIFHQAAISDTTTKDQNLTLQTNLESFRQLLESIIGSNTTLVYASSGATYGDAPAPQTVGRENPGNVYGFSKLMMDRLVAKYSVQHPELVAIGLRYFNVYGPNEYFKGTTASMILQFGLQILKGNAPKLFEGSDKIYRDFIYIEDIIQANIKASTAKKSGIYNVGTGKARSFQEVSDTLQKELGTNYGSQYIPNPYVSQYQFLTEANIVETIQTLQYEPSYTLERGIQAYLPEIKRIYKEELS